MKRTISLKIVLIWIIAFAPLAVAVLFYSRLPETISIHWGADGAVNGTAPRITILPLSCVGILLTALYPVLSRIDPKKENYARFTDASQTFWMTVNLLILGITIMTIVENIRPGTIRVQTFVCVAAGILFVIIGNLMPKFKHNYFIGIRTPWTLADEVVWHHTHRLGGVILVIGGLCIVIAAFLPPLACEIVIIAAIIVMAVVLTWYSWKISKK